MTQQAEQSRSELLTAREVAEELRVSTMTVYRLIRSGQLSALRVGKNYRVRRGELHDYLHGVAVRASGEVTP